MPTATRARKAPPFLADPVPLAFAVDEVVYLRVRARIHRRNHDGSFTVIGDGINRTVPAADLARIPGDFA